MDIACLRRAGLRLRWARSARASPEDGDAGRADRIYGKRVAHGGARGLSASTHRRLAAGSSIMGPSGQFTGELF